MYHDLSPLSEGCKLIVHDLYPLPWGHFVMCHDLSPLSEGVEVMCHDFAGLCQGDDYLSETWTLSPKNNHALRHRRIYNYCLTSKVLSHEKTL